MCAQEQQYSAHAAPPPCVVRNVFQPDLPIRALIEFSTNTNMLTNLCLPVWTVLGHRDQGRIRNSCSLQSYPFSLRWKMSNVWVPLPVALFLRRVVNVISTLFITHHYLFPLPPRSVADTDKIASDRSNLVRVCDRPVIQF